MPNQSRPYRKMNMLEWFSLVDFVLNFGQKVFRILIRWVSVVISHWASEQVRRGMFR